MKIALCFCGQPRFIDQVAPSIFSNVIRDYDVDVFAHLWFDEDLQTKPYKYGGSGGWKDQRIPSNAIEQFEDTYKPKRMVVEKSRKFLNHTLSDNYMPSLNRWKGGTPDYEKEPNFEVRDVNNIHSFCYSSMRACMLKKEYEYENDFKYDYVIRMRTDAILGGAVRYELLPTDTIFYSGTQNQPDGMINDWFNFGGSKVMDSFMSSFSVIDLCIDECEKQTDGAWCCELLHRKMIDFFNIPSQGLPLPVTLPRF